MQFKKDESSEKRAALEGLKDFHSSKLCSGMMISEQCVIVLIISGYECLWEGVLMPLNMSWYIVGNL